MTSIVPVSRPLILTIFGPLLLFPPLHINVHTSIASSHLCMYYVMIMI